MARIYARSGGAEAIADAWSAAVCAGTADQGAAWDSAIAQFSWDQQTVGCRVIAEAAKQLQERCPEHLPVWLGEQAVGRALIAQCLNGGSTTNVGAGPAAAGEQQLAFEMAPAAAHVAASNPEVISQLVADPAAAAANIVAQNEKVPTEAFTNMVALSLVAAAGQGHEQEVGKTLAHLAKLNRARWVRGDEWVANSDDGVTTSVLLAVMITGCLMR